jgi:hypothetical protein
MKKDTLVQFVCFETALELDQFTPQWEHFVKESGNKKPESIILQQALSKTKFKYISEHIWPQDDFQFVFMKGRHSEHFPESRVKVVQAGGYTPLQISHKKHDNEDVLKIMLFTANAQTDISFLTNLQTYRSLNIYQAYYESSIYAYILEYFVQEMHAADLLQQLKAQAQGTEIALYRECLVPAL